MWCSTECWDCEDRSCEHYISKTKLYFENKELKKQIEELNKKIIEYEEREEMQYLIKDEERFNYSMSDQVDY